MTSVPSVLRFCIPASVVLAALAPRAARATSEVCTAPGMAQFELDGDISALTEWGTWLHLSPGGEQPTATAVEGLEPCQDPTVRMSPDGAQFITWQHENQIVSVSEMGTKVTELPEGDVVWGLDAVFVGGAVVVGALVYRPGEGETEPRLVVLIDSEWPAGDFGRPFEALGANCRTGVMAMGRSADGEAAVLCGDTFTMVSAGAEGSFSLSTYPLTLADELELVVARAGQPMFDRTYFFAIARRGSDDIDLPYELLRIELYYDGTSQVERLLDDVRYAGKDHGLAAIDLQAAVYMDEEGLRYVEDWTDGPPRAEVIHPVQPGAKLDASSIESLRVLISEYDVEMLTLTETGWEHQTLFSVGTPPGGSGGSGGSGCSMAGAGPAIGLGQVLLVMLALIAALRLSRAPRLARVRAAAHDAASCASRRS